ncbi:MAG: hypothetical protein JKY94_02900 [Rhodobacteraceae bacterium]|nr:hypothetical protein [Paracoccaceae bacterium]
MSAVMVTDTVGFSRLIEADETAILQRQKRHRKELIDPVITFHILDLSHRLPAGLL